MGYVSVRSRRFKWSGLSSALRASACGASHMIELWLIVAAIGLGVRHLTVSPSKYAGHEGRWGAWGGGTKVRGEDGCVVVEACRSRRSPHRVVPIGEGGEGELVKRIDIEGAKSQEAVC